MTWTTRAPSTWFRSEDAVGYEERGVWKKSHSSSTTTAETGSTPPRLEGRYTPWHCPRTRAGPAHLERTLNASPSMARSVAASPPRTCRGDSTLPRPKRRAAVTVAEEMGVLDAQFVEDGDRVGDRLGGRRRLHCAIRQPASSLVVDHEPAEGGEPLDEMRHGRVLPEVVELGDPRQKVQHVDGAVSHRLVGEVDRPVVGVARLGDLNHH